MAVNAPAASGSGSRQQRLSTRWPAPASPPACRPANGHHTTPGGAMRPDGARPGRQPERDARALAGPGAVAARSWRRAAAAAAAGRGLASLWRGAHGRPVGPAGPAPAARGELLGRRRLAAHGGRHGQWAAMAAGARHCSAAAGCCPRLRWALPCWSGSCTARHERPLPPPPLADTCAGRHAGQQRAAAGQHVWRRAGRQLWRLHRRRPAQEAGAAAGAPRAAATLPLSSADASHAGQCLEAKRLLAAARL